MTGFRLFGNNTTLRNIIDQRRFDVADINNIKEYKLNARDRTGIRDVPSSATDVVNGDIQGDFLYDISGTKKYELVNNSGTLQWIEITIVTSF